MKYKKAGYVVKIHANCLTVPESSLFGDIAKKTVGLLMEE